MKKVIVGVAMMAVLLYLATRKVQEEGLLYMGPHCADQLINCTRGDPTGRVCEQCSLTDGKLKTPYGLPDPNWTFQGQRSVSAGGQSAVGCQMNPGVNVNAYVYQNNSRLNAMGNECGSVANDKCRQNACARNKPDASERNRTVVSNPWNDVSGTCRVWGVLWKQPQGGGGVINECKNGFTPVVRSGSPYVERRGAGGEGITKGHEWYTYLCACEMPGTLFNTLVNEKTSNPNAERQMNYTFDYSKVDPIPEIDKGLTIAGNITFSQAYHECQSWNCQHDDCTW